MTTRNAAAAAAADALSKAGEATVSFYKQYNVWRIRCMHYNTKGVNGVRKEAQGYPTKADAEAEVALFRFAVHHDGGRTWKNWSRQLSVADIRHRNDDYKDLQEPLPKKQRRQLDAAQTKQYKRLRKRVYRSTLPYYARSTSTTYTRARRA